MYLDKLVGEGGGDLNETLSYAVRFTEEITTTLDNVIRFSDWTIFLTAISYTVVPALLVVGALMVMLDSVSTCYQLICEIFLSPLFSLMVTLVWGVAAVMVITADINGDFCLPGGRSGDIRPDVSVLAILAATETDAMAMAVGRWYLSQCTANDDPLVFLLEVTPQLTAGVADLATLLASTFEQPELIQRLVMHCGCDYEELYRTITRLSNLMISISAASNNILEMLLCGEIVLMYVDVVYGDMCTYAPSAVYWVFWCSLVIGILGGIMVTMRAAWQNTVYEDSPKQAELSLEDSIGLILAEDDLSEVPSGRVVQQDLRQKMDVFAAVSNIDFIKYDMARCKELDTGHSLECRIVRQNLEQEFLTSSKSSANSKSANDGSGATERLPGTSANSHTRSTVVCDGNLLKTVPWSLSENIHSIFHNSQSGDSLNWVADEVPDP